MLSCCYSHLCVIFYTFNSDAPDLLLSMGLSWWPLADMYSYSLM